MRPIKSRAWDKKTNSYVEAGFDFRVDGDGYVYRRIWGESQWERTSDLDIEYSTGLKDKKQTKEYPEGQEIYERDIANVMRVPRVAKWGKSMSSWIWSCSLKRGDFEMFCKYLPYQIEVIGNIHEKQKLLGGKE